MTEELPPNEPEHPAERETWGPSGPLAGSWLSETDARDEREHRAVRANWGLGEVVLGFVVAAILSLIIPSAYFYFSGRTSEDPETLGSTISSLACVWLGFAGTAIYAVRKKPGGLAGQLGLSFVPSRDIINGIGLGLLGQLVVVIIYLPLHFIDTGAAKAVSDPAKSLTSAAHGWRWIPFSVAIAGISPFVEELFFRGLTMRALAKKWGPRIGIFGSGLIFGLAHFEGLQTPALVAFGWLLAWRATSTGRIGETIVGHATFNAFTLISLALS